jgi:hypothetical protein
MATKRTSKTQPTPSSTPAIEIGAAELAEHLGIADPDTAQMEALLAAATAEAERFLGGNVPAEAKGHQFQQAVKLLAAKFYLVGNSDVSGPEQLPAVARYFLEGVRSELSGSAQ